MKRFTMAVAAATLAAGPALAGGLVPVGVEPIVAAPPAPIAVAPGFDWSGGYVGGQLGYGDLSRDVDGNGLIGGVHAGFDWDFGGYILGAEIDHDITNIDIGEDASLDSITRLKLRAGIDAGRALVYATGGPAWARADDGGTSLSDNGWFAGVGVGYQMTDRWVMGGEVLSHRFNDFDDTDTDIRATTATLRASFKF
jgi:outer membrane immunogenic protein